MGIFNKLKGARAGTRLCFYLTQMAQSSNFCLSVYEREGRISKTSTDTINQIYGEFVGELTRLESKGNDLDKIMATKCISYDDGLVQVATFGKFTSTIGDFWNDLRFNVFEEINSLADEPLIFFR